MSNLIKHIHFLEKRMCTIAPLPLVFTYYSALYMTRKYQKPFLVYKDIPLHKKQYFGYFFSHDELISDQEGKHVALVDYHNDDMESNKLEQFITIPERMQHNPLELSLIYTHNSTLHIDLHKLISTNKINQISICENEFMMSLKSINKYKNYYYSTML